MANTKNNNHRTRTYARNRTVSRRGDEKTTETDSQYFLKLVIYVILGTLWLKFSAPLMWGDFMITALPIGLVIGLIAINRFEKIQSDRKIWYAVLIIVAIISYFVPAGIII